MRHPLNFSTLTSVLMDTWLDSLKMVCNEENGILSTSTQIQESVYVTGYTIYDMSQVDVKAIK